jgi:hypothetical protein
MSNGFLCIVDAHFIDKIEEKQYPSNGFIYVVDAHFIDKIEEKNILDPSACGYNFRFLCFSTVKKIQHCQKCCH